MKIAVYPGSFDPVTNGHLDIIKRASKLFDRVVVSVMTNPAKKSSLPKERVYMLRQVTGQMDNIYVEQFSGLLVDLCEKMGSNIIVKGFGLCPILNTNSRGPDQPRHPSPA
jgi:pantetheine-phosphate adenylyltransferase